MAAVYVIGDENGRIEAELTARLGSLEAFHLSPALPEDSVILLIAPGFSGFPSVSGISAAVCCGKCTELESPVPFLRCGMSETDAFSFSSIGERIALAEISREIITLTGSVIEKQELLLPLPEHIEPLAALGIFASLLLLGYPPELLL